MLLTLATVDFAGFDSSISLRTGKHISNNFFLDGVGLSIVQYGNNGNQTMTSLKINIFEGAIELKTSTIQTGANGTSYTDYLTYSVNLWPIVLGIVLAEVGAPIFIPA